MSMQGGRGRALHRFYDPIGLSNLFDGPLLERVERQAAGNDERDVPAERARHSDLTWCRLRARVTANVQHDVDAGRFERARAAHSYAWERRLARLGAADHLVTGGPQVADRGIGGVALRLDYQNTQFLGHEPSVVSTYARK